MDWQSAFNIAAGVAGALAGWWLRILWEAQRDLRIDLAKLQKELSDGYVRREDFKDHSTALFAKLDRIEDKLDRKVDKS